MGSLVRTAKEFDLDEVCQHLMMVGDLAGDCYHCKHFGLDYATVKSCPECKNEFRYISSRKSHELGLRIVLSLKKKRPDLEYIEFDDIKHYKSMEKAKGLFS